MTEPVTKKRTINLTNSQCVNDRASFKDTDHLRDLVAPTAIEKPLGWFSSIARDPMYVGVLLHNTCVKDVSCLYTQIHAYPQFCVTQSSVAYGVVSKELLTFLGSLYLVYRFERQTASKKKIVLPCKNTVLRLECRILSQKPPDSFILYFNVIFYGK